MPDHTDELAGRHVVFMSWRDSGNPEAGGAEHFLDEMAAGLVARGAQVTVFSAAYPGAPADEELEGVRYVRRGTKLSVYLQGMRYLLTGRLGHPDVVVDVQNGLPFFAPLVTRAPVVVLVHHVHREQWPIVYPGLTGRVGWWLENRVAPRVYRGRQYVTVSRATRQELVHQKVEPDCVAVVHNGTAPVADVAVTRASYPMLCVLCRLVPHKQVEHAIDAVLTLRDQFPGLRLHVIGDGWWRGQLHEYAADRSAAESVIFEGHVSEERKQELLERAWLMLLPSVKEGWGLVVGEAGQHSTPTIAYASAGGTRESIHEGVSGLLVADQAAMISETRRLLDDPVALAALSRGAREHSDGFDWEQSRAAFADVLRGALRGEIVDESR